MPDFAPIPADQMPPSGQQIYDAIMAQIEAELTSEAYPTLAEKYKDETPEDHEVRMARYEKAFAEYDNRYAGFMAQVTEEARSTQRAARVASEEMGKEEDQSAEQDILSKIESV